MLVLVLQANQSLGFGDHLRAKLIRINSKSAATLQFTSPISGRRLTNQIERVMNRDEVHEIDQAVTITVIDIREDKVRLGVEAPLSMRVRRIDLGKF